MTLSLILSRAGFMPRRIRAPVKTHIKKGGEGVKIMHIDLGTEADIPNINAWQFQEQAEAAKGGCPVSQVLTGTKVSQRYGCRPVLKAADTASLVGCLE